MIELRVFGRPGESSIPVYFSPLHISAVWPCEDHDGSAVWVSGKGVTQVEEAPRTVACLVSDWFMRQAYTPRAPV